MSYLSEKVSRHDQAPDIHGRDTLTDIEKVFVKHEGWRTHPYKDTEGILTIGVGINLEGGLLEHEIVYLMRSRIQVAQNACRALILHWDGIDFNRRMALINMAFNIGQSRLAGFKNMLAAIQAKDWDKAADEALDSKWARQVGHRAIEIAGVLRSGEWHG